MMMILKCGSDYARTNQSAQVGLELSSLSRYIPLDGDADRLVYHHNYYYKSTGLFSWLNILVLLAVWLAMCVDA